MYDEGISRLRSETESFFLTDVLGPEHIILDLQSDSCEEVYMELIARLVPDSKPEMQQRCLHDILNREKKASTFLGHGVALPHSLSSGVKRLKAALGLKAHGLTCGREKIKIFLLCLCPEEQHRRYLHFIYQAANILLMPENRQGLLQAASVEQALEILQSTY
ncbi:MAG: PTS transporter subunit EIIA [Oligosphaeraceae bacterium]|nr:PTS transporter subunit EIIA [Oligosphaeraceae bacterium]